MVSNSYEKRWGENPLAQARREYALGKSEAGFDGAERHFLTAAHEFREAGEYKKALVAFKKYERAYGQSIVDNIRSVEPFLKLKGVAKIITYPVVKLVEKIVETGYARDVRRHKKTKGLEGSLAAITVIIFASSIFLLSQNITGFSIFNSANYNYNLFGGILFIIGLFVIWTYSRYKRLLR